MRGYSVLIYGGLVSVCLKLLVYSVIHYHLSPPYFV